MFSFGARDKLQSRYIIFQVHIRDILMPGIVPFIETRSGRSQHLDVPRVGGRYVLCNMALNPEYAYNVLI